MTKLDYLNKLTDDKGVISALAFDQRGALKRMISKYQSEEPTVEQIERLKEIVSEELTPYASSILLDPEYGLPAAQARDDNAGLLLAYEKTGYDATTTDRLPDCLVEWSVKRIKEQGADAVKFLLYYDVDGSGFVNLQKQAYMERIGSECAAEDIPFFLEILAYDENIEDNGSLEFAKVKAHKVNGAMKVFSQDRFGVDVLKVEVPYIYLSAGVSAKLFQDTLEFAYEAGARFNGVLCGRATWAGSVQVFIEQGEEAAREWLQTEGRKNIEDLNEVLNRTAVACDFGL